MLMFLSVLNEYLSIMNGFVGIFQDSRCKNRFEISVKKTKLLILRISEGEEVMSSSEKMNQVDSFTYVGCLIGKDSELCEVK